jgi:RNA polymerase sigma factor (sigma-70 family)
LTEDIPDLSFKMPEDGGLAESISKLPDIDRDIVLLRADNELRFREIAEIMNMKTDTVRKRYHRVLEKLAASLRSE